MTSIVHFLSLRCQIHFCRISNHEDLTRWLLVGVGGSLIWFQISRTQIVMNI